MPRKRTEPRFEVKSNCPRYFNVLSSSFWEEEEDGEEEEDEEERAVSVSPPPLKCHVHPCKETSQAGSMRFGIKRSKTRQWTPINASSQSKKIGTVPST